MKKVVIAVIFLFSTMLCLISQPAFAAKSLVEYQIADVLMSEVRSGGEVSMSRLAGIIRNRYLEERDNPNITYTDILYNGAFSTALRHSGKNFSDYTHWESDPLWQTALITAQKTVEGNVPREVAGYNDFVRSNGPKGALHDDKTGYYFFVTEHNSEDSVNHDQSLPTDAPQAEPESTQPPESPAEQHYGENSDGSEEAGGCRFEAMRKIYMEDTNDAKLCWYCNVVIVLMNSFFRAASQALPSSIALGKLILEIGFMVWLAYFMLQQLASFTPTTTGKMLQEILKMGFKVALAYAFLSPTTEQLIAYYFINPVLDLGLKYGLDLFAGMASEALH